MTSNSPTIRRTGASSQALVYGIASLAVIGLLGWLLMGIGGEDDGPDELVLYCAAGIQKPVAEAVQQYQEETFGIPVRIQYGGSGTLLANLQTAKTGDLYLAADISYMDIAREKGVLAETIPLAVQRPVIAVKKGNPKKIRSIADLLRPEVKFALANPDAASIGKLTRKVLTTTGEWDAVKARVKVFKPTVNDIITDVEVGSVDAAVVWDANVAQKSDTLDAVHTKAFDAAKKTVTIGVLKWTQSSAKALQIARYLQAPEKGQKVFEKYGYETLPDADHWAIKPTIHISSGGVNRVAIQQTLKEFQAREGIDLIVKYNGCGIIVGEIKGGDRPDAYFACDASFMVQVQDKFHESLILSETDMVIIVPKDNPKNIAALKDLTQSGLRVGVTNPKQSALGELTRKLLKSVGLLQAVEKNISVRTPTADMLVNGLRGHALDAAIVYRANVSQIKDEVHVIAINEGRSKAVQPIAIGKESKYPHLVQRLVDALRSDLSRNRFKSADFRWLLQESK
ncbi:MAG: molybdate ABC transporter substrate-binding protein [Planctomycetaceae bacterium]